MSNNTIDTSILTSTNIRSEIEEIKNLKVWLYSIKQYSECTAKDGYHTKHCSKCNANWALEGKEAGAIYANSLDFSKYIQ